MRFALGALLIAMGCASGSTAGSEDAGGNPDARFPGSDSAVGEVDAASNADAAVGPDATVTIDAQLPPDANPANPPVIQTLTPDNASVVGGEAITVNGSNFTSDITISFGVSVATCTYVNTIRLDCIAPAGGVAGIVDVSGTQAGGSHTLMNSFTYWDTASGVDGCSLVAPTAVDQLQGDSYTWRAHVLEVGITDTTTGNDPSASLLVQYGYGPVGTDPTTATGWIWVDATPTAGYGPASSTYQANWDEYELGDAVPPRDQYSWAFRASVENGVSWRFCDIGTITSRSPITCAADATCFADELCIGGRCRVDCASNTDCFGWGPACGGLATLVDGTTLALYCLDSNAGGGDTGTTCASDSECLNNFCLTITDQCTGACDANDAECGGGGQICTELSGLGLCSPSCIRNTDCDVAGGKFCVVNQNTGQNRYDQICVEPSGTDVAGADCSVTNNCQSGLCLSSGGQDLCTEFCITNGDCPPATPSCGQATITLPGGGTQTLDVCVP